MPPIKIVRKGNAYAFAVLSDRAFGKLKERHEVEVGPYREMTDDELRERIRAIARSTLSWVQIRP